MGYFKINLTQNNDYIAVRAGSRFALHLTNNSNFGGAKVKVYKAMTNKNGEIGWGDKTNKDNGSQGHLTYTVPVDTGFNPVTNNVWYIFEVSDATPTTNIEVTIDIEYTKLDTNDLQAKNIRTNIPLIQQI